ncbi:MAG: glycosyltransferase family 4 protein [Planctomycetota bacterium]|nr:glycosyltransferase family 4 protein [Planctomycetota bacterium]
MNILYHHRTQAEDGQAVHIRSLVRAFEGLGHGVREVALVEKTGEADPARGETTAPGGADGEGRAFPWSLVGQVPRFVREVAEYAYTVPAARRLRAAIAEGRPDFIYERYAFGNAAGVKVARSEGIPLVLEVNSPMVLELSRTRGLSFPRHARRVETSIFKSADRVAVVTRVLGDMLVDMGVDPDRVFITPNGVHLDQFASPDREAARADLGIGHVDGPVLGFTGYYRDWHRLDLVIDGMKDDAALGHAHLVLVGTGPVEEELRDRAVRRGVGQRVHFAGTRPHHRIPAILPAFDVGLVPAINPYASPLKLHEYMAAGVVPVAPDQPNLREVLTHGEDSLLFPPGDGAALNESLGRVAADASLRETLGAAARSAVTERDLTWEGNARRVVSEVELIDK